MKTLNIQPGFKLFLIGLGVIVAIAVAFFYPLIGTALATAFLFGTVTTEETEEMKALKTITEQMKGFKTTLGDKADKTEFEEIKKNLKELKDGLNGKMTSEEVSAKIKEINDAMLKVATQVGEMQADIQKTKEGQPGVKKGEFVSLADIQKFVKETFGEDGRKTSNKASIPLNGESFFRRKAAEIFGYPQFFEGAAGTVSDAFTGRFVDPTLYERKRKRNLILDNWEIGTITVPKLLFLVKEEISGDDGSSEDTGGADWIVSGGQKPMRSFRVTTGEAEAKKVAIFGTVEDKLLKDVPSLENWIRDDFMKEIAEKYNDALLNNNPAVDADAPLGLKQNAIQFAPSDAFDGTIENANEIDAITAIAAYMATLHEPLAKVFVSDDVYFKIMILKDNEGRYQNNSLVYINNLGQLYISGVQVIKADSEDVPSTHVLAVAEDPGFKIKNYGPMVFERGLNGEDFRHDRTSYRGYQEVLSYLPTHRENSILYDTWANVFAGIELTS